MLWGDLALDPGPVVERVQRGAGLLDSKVPQGWVDRIDVSQLDVTSGVKCPLGQEFGDFGLGMASIGLYTGEAQMYGFALYRPDDGPLLNEAWRELIARRRLLKTLEPAVVYAEAAS